MADLVEQQHVRRAAEALFRTAAPSDSSSPPDSHPEVAPANVFVSSSHGDEDFAKELSDKMEEAAITHFKSDRDIGAASDWAEKLWDAIRKCKVFLVVLTPRFLDSDWYRIESGAACASEKQVLVVLRYVDRDRIIEPLRQFQSIVVENSDQLGCLIRELKRLCQDSS